jgi:hypothetical protein
MKRLSELANKYGFVAHPLLFAVFPLLSFYGANAAELRSSDFQFTTFLVFNFVVVIAGWLISFLLTRNKQKASILTLVLLIIFFAFGRIHDQIQDFGINTPLTPLGPTKILGIASLVIIALAWIWLRRLPAEKTNKVNSTLTLVSLVIVSSTLFSIVPNLSVASVETNRSNASQTTEGSRGSTTGEKPDIYYILLDGYARSDRLKESFNYDNTQFINSLEEKGFYVADKANSNYAHTHFSVPSTFNMKYLNYLADEMGEESNDRTPLKELTQNHEIGHQFKSMGYKYVAIGSQWSWAESSPLADIEVKAKNHADSEVLNIELSEFALVYMQTTAVKPLISTELRKNFLSRVLGAFEKTEEVSKISEPTLSFTHILSPHPPYLFDSNGIIRGKTKLQLLNEGFSHRDKFKEQTIYVNKLALDLVDKILKNSEKPPIIMLASDHGPATDLGISGFKETDPKKFNKKGIRNRISILSTYYFPDQDYSMLYPEISPVNSFRVVLNKYFNENLKLLEDRSYLSDNGDNQYLMHDVTDIVKE